MKRVVKIVLITIILIIIVNNSYAKFSTKINGEGKAKLKTPILILENNDMIIGEISKLNNLYQSDFSLKNYIENGSNINEIDFEYSIKLIPSTLNFPVKYSLINLETNKEIALNENLETAQILMGTEKIIHKYRLIVSWTDITNAEAIEENLDVKIKIKATQIEKENS